MAHAATGPSKNIRYFHPHETGLVHALAGIPLASFPRRFFAYAIDFLFLSVTYLPLALLVRWIAGDFKREQQIHVDLSFHDPYSLVWIVLYFGLATFFGNGKTIGKKLMGIRVVSLTHPRLTLFQSVERALGYGASALEAGFGFLQYFMHPNRCCVHDRIAETIVVREQR